VTLAARSSIEEIQGLENSDLEGNLNLVEGLEHVEIETNGVRLLLEFLAGGLPGSR